MSLEQSITGATIDAGGISLKYFAAGVGEPVVLLHGTAGSGRQWTDVAEALREGGGLGQGSRSRLDRSAIGRRRALGDDCAHGIFRRPVD
jgi:pimeloyl-ACP methyl ester carboxylesterase